MGDLENYQQELVRLETLTDLVEFAKQQKAKGSTFTAGWAGYHEMNKWQETIGYLRTVIPDNILKGFDNERKRGQHRENCECMLCEERRTDS